MKKILFVLLCTFGLGNFQIKAQFIDLYTLIAFVDLIGDMNQGGVEYRYTEIDGQIAPTIGVKGSWEISDDLNFGFSAQGTSASITDLQGHVKKLKMLTSTTFVEFEALKNRSIELHPNIGYGWGYAEVTGISYYDNLEYTEFWVLEPQMNAVMYLNRHFKFNVGAGYRLVMGANYGYLTNSLLSGPTVGAGLTFGIYDRP